MSFWIDEITLRATLSEFSVPTHFGGWGGEFFGAGSARVGVNTTQRKTFPGASASYLRFLN